MRHKGGRVFHHTVVLALRLFLGGMFVYASLHKLADPVAFGKIIYGYKIMPAWSINAFAMFLPGVEFVAGVFLLAGFLCRGSALTVSLCLAVFIAAISYNLARGLEFDCGCFSFARTRHAAAADLLVRDVIFFAMALRVLFAGSYPFSLDWLFGIEKRGQVD